MKFTIKVAKILHLGMGNSIYKSMKNKKTENGIKVKKVGVHNPYNQY